MAKKNTAKKEVKTIEATPESAAADRKAELLNLVSELGTKSAKIRKLAASGVTTGEIAKVLDIRYQHVRNVLTTELKRGARA